MKKLYIVFLFISIIAISFLISCDSKPISQESSKITPVNVDKIRKVKNLEAFAKVYGYVRFFEPSKQASEIDWEKFAIYGVDKVQYAISEHELKQILDEIFFPITQSINILTDSNQPNYDFDTLNTRIIGWVHKGVELKNDKRNNIYKSEKKTIRLDSKYYENNAGIKIPFVDDIVHEQISDSLFYFSPLALPVSKTYFSNKKIEFDLTNTNSGNLRKNIRIADIIITWNVIQHFYPYFDVINTNWKEVLNYSLNKSLLDKSEIDHYYTLREMIANLHDGHGAVINRNVTKNREFMPFIVEWIENQAVVVKSKFEDLVKIGDIILSVNGIDSENLLQYYEKYISGSSQWKRWISTQSDFSLWRSNERVILKIVRNNKNISIDLEPQHKISNQKYYNFKYNNKDIPSIKQIENGIIYIDLRNKGIDEEFNENIKLLAEANGLIFDLRGYPGGKPKFIQHLTDDVIRSAKWKTPLIIYPNFQKVNYDTSGRWIIKPQSPKIIGNVIFLTNESAISYAESIMGIIENYKLGDIVGKYTAGTNGNANQFSLPSGNSVRFTGMKVVKHDDTQHHLIGIKPTHHVEKTIDGVKEGRDELLEYAIDLIKSK